LLTTEDKNKKKNQDTIVDEWIVENFRNKLKKAAVIASALNKPLALYNNIIEENEDSAKEEIVLHNQKYITVQTFTRGGFLPTSFQEQHIFTIDKFITWAIKERKDRKIILQCLHALEKEYAITIEKDNKNTKLS
jgi:translation elongation factor EF-Ts